MMHADMGSTALWLMLLLGAYHGVNPGMGWLFAVALGMQEQKGSAVAKSLVPIAIGHALAIGSVVMVAAFLGRALPLLTIRYSVAALLVGIGIVSLLGHWHPRWVRMRVGFRDLDSLVVSDGFCTRRRFDGDTGVARAAARSKHTLIWPATVTYLRLRLR